MSLDSHDGGSDVDLATVIGRYALGELSLGEAAEQAGVSKIRMQEMLNEAGVDLRLGPETKDDVRSEMDVARRANE